ncbi:MAG: DUF4065 domain-containing protein [Pedobacter sp.]|nr:MAG: DUF4065 domain-containing protein [Pedobacter sp.]
MQSQEKLLYFEYTIKSLINWYAELGCREEENNFSVLKSLKLLFFVSAANSEPSKKSLLLEDVFDEFFALPYGHVESSVYKEIKNQNGALNYYHINNSKVSLLENADLAVFEGLAPEITNEIDASIGYLKEANKFLVKMSPFDLVNLSHAWYSWQKYYKIAKDSGGLSSKIPFSIIKAEDKLFKLTTF